KGAPSWSRARSPTTSTIFAASSNERSSRACLRDRKRDCPGFRGLRRVRPASSRGRREVRRQVPCPRQAGGGAGGKLGAAAARLARVRERRGRKALVLLGGVPGPGEDPAALCLDRPRPRRGVRTLEVERRLGGVAHLLDGLLERQRVGERVGRERG